MPTSDLSMGEMSTVKLVDRQLPSPEELRIASPSTSKDSDMGLTPSDLSDPLPTSGRSHTTSSSAPDQTRPDQTEVIENNPTLPSLSMVFPNKKRSRTMRISLCNAHCRSSIRAVRAATKRLGWEEIPHETSEASLVWMEHHDNPSNLTPHQVVSKIEGLLQLCRKSTVANLVNRMRDAFPHQYQFVPRTWVLRKDDLEQAMALEKTMNEKKGWIYICKPSAGSEGRGVQLVKKWSDLKCILNEVWPDPQEQPPPRKRRAEYVVQRYVSKPLCVDGYKFDCRVYVVVTSLLPLVAYIFEEGLGKLCTVPYERPRARNFKNTFMHLTNYSVNKHSAEFQASRAHDAGSKRSLSAILRQVEQNGGPTAVTMFAAVTELCERTLLAMQPGFIEHYSTRAAKVGMHPHGPKGFQIIGFDILFEKNYRLRLLEVNSNPSLSCLTPMADPTSTDYAPLRKPDGAPKLEISTLDYAVKVELIAQACLVANPMPHEKMMRGRQIFIDRYGEGASGTFSEQIPTPEQRENANPPLRPDLARKTPGLRPLDFSRKSHSMVLEAIEVYETLYRIYRDSLTSSSLFTRAAFRHFCGKHDLLCDSTFFNDRAQADVFFAFALHSAYGESVDHASGLTYSLYLRFICCTLGMRLDSRCEIHALMALAERLTRNSGGNDHPAEQTSTPLDFPI